MALTQGSKRDPIAPFKGGCAHFTMCILHFQLIELDLWNAFCEVSPWGNFLFTLQMQLKYATLGMRLWCKYIRNYLLVYQLISHFLPYLQNYKEFEGDILDLQLEKYGLSFETKKYTTSGWAWGDENVVGIRAFKYLGSIKEENTSITLTKSLMSQRLSIITCNLISIYWGQYLN